MIGRPQQVQHYQIRADKLRLRQAGNYGEKQQHREAERRYRKFPKVLRVLIEPVNGGGEMRVIEHHRQWQQEWLQRRAVGRAAEPNERNRSQDRQPAEGQPVDPAIDKIERARGHPGSPAQSAAASTRRGRRAFRRRSQARTAAIAEHVDTTRIHRWLVANVIEFDQHTIDRRRNG